LLLPQAHTAVGVYGIVKCSLRLLSARNIACSKGSWICRAPHCEKLASEALRHGSRSFYAATTPHLPFYAATTPHLPYLVKHSPDGTTSDSDNSHLIAAYYSFVDPREDERLSWPSWLTYSGRFTHINGYSLPVGHVQARESSPARDRRSTTELHRQRVIRPTPSCSVSLVVTHRCKTVQTNFML